MAVRPVGPGPGAYMMPTTVGYEKHDSRKQRMPQYSFGMRTNIMGRVGVVGPGPGAYKVDKLTRYGKETGLEFTMAPRTPNVAEKRVGPGPGAHDVHLKPFFTGTNAPAYSIGMRTEANLKRFGPGPNAYKFEMNPVKPQAPAYSMGLKTQQLGKGHGSPGPAAYLPGDLNVNLTRAPEYSMSPRTGVKGKGFGPGPIYDLMYYRPGRTGPGYSFGMRHSPYAPPLIVKCDNM